MDKKKYSSAVINANYKASLWMLVAAALLVSNLMLASFVMTADTTEKTIIVPPALEKPFSIQGSEVSPEYLEQMSRYLSQLLLTYQKSNAQHQFDTFLRYTDPTVYNEMRNRFSIEYDRISRNDISSVFYLMGIHIKSNVAVLSGELNGFIGSHLVSKKQKTYEMRFKYDGQLTITGFSELMKNSMGEYETIQQDEEVMVDSPAVSDPSASDPEVQSESTGTSSAAPAIYEDQNYAQ